MHKVLEGTLDEKWDSIFSRSNEDLNDLMKKKVIFDIISEYNRFCGGVGFQNHKTIRIERVHDLSMYPTFKDYCNKVLGHQKKL